MTETAPPQQTQPTQPTQPTPGRWQQVREAQVRVTSVAASVVILLVGAIIGFGIAQAGDDSGPEHRYEDGRGHGPGMDQRQIPQQRQGPGQGQAPQRR